MIYSYCRVSTEQQSLERQEEAVSRYCKENNVIVDREFSDKISGKTFNRDEYLEMKNLVQKNDIIIIKELDRFGRSMDLIKEEWRYFMDKGVRIIVIDMPLISSSLDGEKSLDMRFISNLVFEVLCYSAEKEREKISQRTKEALAVKKQNGVKLGRPDTYTDDFKLQVLNDYQAGLKVNEILEKYGISRQRLFVWKKQFNINGRNKWVK